jgi:hypothetical protein
MSGPLANHVSFELGRAAASLHGKAFNVLLALVAFHVAAVGFYLIVKRENLVGAMITGRKQLGPDAAPLEPAHGVTLFLCLALAGATTAWVFLS